MYRYPSEFPERSRARVHAERIRSVRAFEQAKQGARYKPEIEALLRTCILRIFLVFAEEAAELGRRGMWPVDKMEAQATEFLRVMTIEFHYEKGHDSSGAPLPDVISSWDGSILPAAQRDFERSPQWKQYENLLLEVAESQAAIDGPDSSSIGAGPEVIADRGRRRGYRPEVRQWMAREGVSTQDEPNNLVTPVRRHEAADLFRSLVSLTASSPCTVPPVTHPSGAPLGGPFVRPTGGTSGGIRGTPRDKDGEI